MAFTGLKAAGGSWGGRHHQGPSGINALVKTNHLSRKKFPTLVGLHRPQGRWRVLGGQTTSGTMGDQRFGQNEPFEPEKISGLGWPSPASRPLEGLGGARHHQGPSGINALVKTNCLSRKKLPALVGLHRPQGCWRVLGGPDTIRDHRGSTLWSKQTV